MANTAVAKKEAAEMEAYAEYLGGMVDDGMEEVERGDLAIPFINVLQSNSDKVESDEAKAGELLNNVMGTVHKELTIVPCYVQKMFVEWVPYDDGGGLVGMYTPKDPYVIEALNNNNGSAVQLKVPREGAAGEENDLVETIYLYCLVLDEDGEYQQCVIGFSSMKLKKYRQWITRARGLMMKVGDRKIRLPLWAHKYKVTTVQEVAKSNGKKFWNIELDFAEENAKNSRMVPSDELFQAGEAFYDLVKSGAAKADMSTADGAAESSGAESDSGDRPKSDLDDEEIPF